MEAKRILCFVLILVCLAEARDLKRQDSRHNRMYGFYSDYSYMDPYSSAGYPGYSSMDPYSSAGYPGYSYMDPYSSAGYPGYSSMDPYSSAGYPGYSYMDPYTSAGYPGYNSMDPYSSAGYHGYSYMDPYSSAGYPGYSYMDPYSMHNNPIDSSASYMGYSNNIDLYSSIDTNPVSSINDYSSDYQSSWESFSNYFDSSYSRFPSSNYDDYYPDMGIVCFLLLTLILPNRFKLVNSFQNNKFYALANLRPVYTFTIFSTIHHDSPRFLMVRKIGMDRDESWRKVEIFNVTTIPVRMSTILVRCL